MTDEIVIDADGFIEAVVDGPNVHVGRPRHVGEHFATRDIGFHECIPQRYIDSEEGVTGFHCSQCGLIMSRANLPRARLLTASTSEVLHRSLAQAAAERIIEGGVAQSEERTALARDVAGSNPAAPTRK